MSTKDLMLPRINTVKDKMHVVQVISQEKKKHNKYSVKMLIKGLSLKNQ